jgi:GNAT superfamily N-acetyltransferase
VTDVSRVSDADLGDLLPLLRGYCDFYEVDPSDEDLLTMARALIADPDREGIQLIARSDDGEALGFATIFWSWSTSIAARIGIMNDLFVAPAGRGTGLVDALIAVCVDECRRRGAAKLTWQTAPDNATARRVYERVGATREEWLDYWLTSEA